MSYWYLATPYTKYPLGLESAFDLACANAAILMEANIAVFCPIAHTHPIARRSKLSQTDSKLWLALDRPLMEAAHGLIMLTAESWRESYGMKMELDYFRTQGKPVLWMNPGQIPAELAPKPLHKK